MNKNSTWKIIAKHTFTLFNLVNVILAVMVAFVGNFKNMLFIGIAIVNTLISIVNELRAKKIVDKMRLLSEQRPTVLKNGKSVQIPIEEVKKDDILVLSLGDQITFDSEIISGTLEVNEALITGEQDNIEKNQGDLLTSGSFVVSGMAKAKVIHVGEENFVSKLQNDAGTIKTADSKLFTLMNKIVKYISYSLIPIGALLLWARFRTEPDSATAITSTVAALINMIPEGLVLLTSSVLALATVRLSRKKVLVQDLYAIETLARVDTICLDKTGTLTTGNMNVKDIILPDGTIATDFEEDTPDKKRLISTLKSILSYLPADNHTSTALAKKFLKTAKNKATSEIPKNIEVIPFSSDRKYSGYREGKTEYLMGATEFLTKDAKILKIAAEHKSIYRLLAIVKKTSQKTELIGFVRLEDEIRPTAPKIIDYFYKNDIKVKIISGDDLETVTEIARKVGVVDLRGIDLSSVESPNFNIIVKEYAIFTRVKPDQKKALITAFKKQGATVAMTGDGVNDILAMKEADASIAIGEGSDAARRAAKFVLLNSGFEAVPSIIDEGRQSINNLERSTSLFLTKTIYASILAIAFVFLPTMYPYTPIEMTLLNFVCIGFPGLVLALEHNTARIKDKFIYNIKHYSVPTGVIIAIAMIVLSIVATNTNMAKPLLSTLSASITFAIDLFLIYKISKPLNLFRTGLILLIILILVLALTVPIARTFFEFI